MTTILRIVANACFCLRPLPKDTIAIVLSERAAESLAFQPTAKTASPPNVRRRGLSVPPAQWARALRPACPGFARFPWQVPDGPALALPCQHLSRPKTGAPTRLETSNDL